MLALFSMLAVSLGSTVHFVLVFSGMVLLYTYACMRKRQHVLLTGVHMLKRLRWFFLSVVLVYGWMGVSAEVDGNGWSFILPDITGLQAGLYRILVIAVFALMVNLVLATVSRDELIEGLYFLLFPLKLLGLNIDRVAVRIVMVLALLEEMFLTLKLLRKSMQANTWMQRITQACSMAYADILDIASRKKGEYIEFSIRAPAILEWCLPVVLLALFLSV